MLFSWAINGAVLNFSCELMTPFEKEQQWRLGLKVVRFEEEKIAPKLKIFRLEALRSIISARNFRAKERK